MTMRWRDWLVRWLTEGEWRPEDDRAARERAVASGLAKVRAASGPGQAVWLETDEMAALQGTDWWLTGKLPEETGDE